jgi:hypothetical protein
MKKLYNVIQLHIFLEEENDGSTEPIVLAGI